MTSSIVRQMFQIARRIARRPSLTDRDRQSRMTKTWKNAPSPCIDVCKFKRKGRCIGCSMSREDKASFKRLDSKEDKKAFLTALVERLREQGGLPFWATAYRRKCEKQGVPCPLDKLTVDA
ncbi:DUF1289 domain-containing protein [Afifella aestuarii]|uniref:DUF1289 domain-containing protein n=1 Tax=Afifella aestuarii TaxID=1909496 RepID=UPI001FEB8B23|nr:DUF1289 domain-containing protein [Afifella aestuarii]